VTDPSREDRHLDETARDLADYTARYRALPFEPLQLRFRRRRVLSRVAVHAPRRLAEVGCGEFPLFLDLPDVEAVVIEPTAAFAANARRLAADRPGITVVEEYAERVPPESVGGTVDMVVVSHRSTDSSRSVRDSATRTGTRPGRVDEEGAASRPTGQRSARTGCLDNRSRRRGAASTKGKFIC